MKENKKAPKIRFPEFTDDWEQCKLSDAIEKLTGGASIAPEDYTEEGYRTIPKGAVNDSGVADMSGCKYVSGTFFAKNSTSKTSAGELVTSLRDLVPTAPNIGRIVRIYGDSEEFLMPQGVYSIKVKDNVSEDFLITYSNSPIYRKIIMAEKNGSTQVHIRNGEFLNIDFPMPSCDEQNKIGSYFRNLNNLITLHQRKCDKIKELKSCMLQKMFPKKGDTKPEIRFPEFNDDWEQRKVSELGDVITGNTPPTKDKDNYDGSYLFVSPADIQGNRYVDKTITTLTEKGFNLGRKLSPGSTLFVSIGSTIGKVAQIKDFAISNQQINAVVPSSDYDNNFVFTAFENISPTIKALSAQQAVPIVNKTTFSEVELFVPHIEEQAKIGEYFSNIDILITLHQRKCDALKELKKGMLQKMFV